MPKVEWALTIILSVFEELAKMIMEDESLSSPSKPGEALQLYIDLVEHIEDIMQT